MAIRGPIIIDVDPSDLVVDGRRPVFETDKAGIFTRKTFIYGMKAALNFVGWGIKETLKMMIEGIKMAAQGNKEMNEELRRSRPRHVSKRPMFYIPTKEEEMENGVSLKRYRG